LVLLIASGVIYLGITCSLLLQDKITTEDNWNRYMSETGDETAVTNAVNAGATPVAVGTYIENFKSISIKNCNFEVEGLIWFRWTGDDTLNPAANFRFYKGTTKTTKLKDITADNGEHYQLVRFDTVITRNFWNRRFPLETHQLNIYAESNYPIERMVFTADADSGMNNNLSISGYNIIKYGTLVRSQQYDSKNGDPTLNQPVTTSEYLTAIMINRSSWGTYIKCFIALVGTITWVMITLFICTYHRVDPLTMIPAALFGTVTNLMVGANLLPDAMEVGLLEYVNFFGIAIILIGATGVINVNRIRNKYESRAFSSYYGSVYLVTLLTFTIIGNILLPVCAYVW
jgi:hypothetical protein